MAGENLESNAFLQMNETLSMGIREALLSIAEAALSRKIIHENTLSEVLSRGYPIEVRSQHFLKSIRDRIRVDPSAFHVFVSILESQHSMEYLGIKLKESLSDQKEDFERRQSLAAARTHTLNSSPRQVEMVLSNGQPIVTRPTQLVAPGEQLHSYTRMQHVQLPAKPATFGSLSHNHSGALHHSSLTTHPATTKMGDHEPRSEPVIKYTTSPGMVFRKSIALGTANMSSTSDVIAVTRRAVTPGPETSDSRRISSSGLTGKNIPRTFEKNYRWVGL